MNRATTVEPPGHKAELAIPADDPAQLARTRRACREAFERWGLDAGHPPADSAIVIVSELVTNVHLHACPPSTFAEVTLRLDDGRLTIEVHDRHPGRPQVRQPPASDRPRGRGLLLVHGLAAEEGGSMTVIMDSDDLGKTIKVELPVPVRRPARTPSSSTEKMCEFGQDDFR